MNLTKTALYISCALTTTVFAHTDANLTFSNSSKTQAEYHAEQTQLDTSSNMQSNASGSFDQQVATNQSAQASESTQSHNQLMFADNNSFDANADEENGTEGGGSVTKEPKTETKENTNTAKADSKNETSSEASMSVDSASYTDTLTKTGTQLQTKLGESQTLLQESLTSGVTTSQNVLLASGEKIDIALTGSVQQATAISNNLSSSVEQNTSVIVEQAIDNTVNANLAGELLSSTEALTNAEVNNVLTQTISATINATTEQSVNSSLTQNIGQSIEKNVAQNVSNQINNAVALTVDNSVDNAINASSGLGI